MNVSEISQLLVAGGVGGAIMSLVSSTSDRRRIRDNVFRALSAVENRGIGDGRLEEYISAALLAGVPRALVRAFVDSHYAAYVTSSNVEALAPSQRAQQMDELMTKASAAREAHSKIAEVHVRLVWYPVLWRVLWRVKLRRIPIEYRHNSGWKSSL